MKQAPAGESDTQPGGAGVRDEIKQEPKKEVPIKAEIPQVTVEAKPPVAGTVDQNTPSSEHEKPPAPSQPATPVSAQYEPSLAPETPSKAPPATPSMLGVGKGYGTGSNMWGREPDEGHYYSPYSTASLPPPVLSQSAIEGRLRRIFKPRKDGTFLVDQSWVKQFNEKDNRDQLYSMFEKVGYNPDRGAKLELELFCNNLRLL